MMIASQQKAINIVRAICVLHNYLRTVGDPTYTPTGFADTPNQYGLVSEGFWRLAGTRFHSNRRTSRSATMDGIAIREQLCNYFNGRGSVPWQHGVINRK